jgi:hypothetical protein
MLHNIKFSINSNNAHIHSYRRSTVFFPKFTDYCVDRKILLRVGALFRNLE